MPNKNQFQLIVHEFKRAFKIQKIWLTSLNSKLTNYQSHQNILIPTMKSRNDQETRFQNFKKVTTLKTVFEFFNLQLFSLATLFIVQIDVDAEAAKKSYKID